MPPLRSSRRRVLTATLLALGSLTTAGVALAQTWPARPITIVVPFPAGGGTDLVIRSIQPLLQKDLGQPVVVENRGGAGGTIGSAYVAKATPDGYTAVLATTSTHAVSVSVYPQLPYNPIEDFAYAGFIGTSPYVLAVNPAVAGDDVKALVATLKEKPEGYSFASVGTGSVSHLLGEQFKAYADVPLVHIPYRGAAPAYTDLMGGQVQLMFDNPVGLAPYIRSGKLRAVATTASSVLLDGVPTFAQQGVENFNQSLWYGVAFPRDTPADIVERFNTALNKALTDPNVAADFSAKGLNVRPSAPAELQAAVANDISYWGGIAKAVGATID